MTVEDVHRPRASGYYWVRYYYSWVPAEYYSTIGTWSLLGYEDWVCEGDLDEIGEKMESPQS